MIRGTDVVGDRGEDVDGEILGNAFEDQGVLGAVPAVEQRLDRRDVGLALDGAQRRPRPVKDRVHGRVVLDALDEQTAIDVEALAGAPQRIVDGGGDVVSLDADQRG